MSVYYLIYYLHAIYLLSMRYLHKTYILSKYYLNTIYILSKYYLYTIYILSIYYLYTIYILSFIILPILYLYISVLSYVFLHMLYKLYIYIHTYTVYTYTHLVSKTILCQCSPHTQGERIPTTYTHLYTYICTHVYIYIYQYIYICYNYPLLTYLPHTGEGEITYTYIPIWAHTHTIWGSSLPLYLYIITYTQ